MTAKIFKLIRITILFKINARQLRRLAVVVFTTVKRQIHEIWTKVLPRAKSYSWLCTKNETFH